jgi:hypothetical protein
MEKQEEKVAKLTEKRDQLLKLRNDSSLVVGVTFNTVAGDIRIDNKETALLLLDYLISDTQKRINYLMK